MKKVSLVFALILGFAATSFAQLGGTQCARGMEQRHSDVPNAHFSDIPAHGISDSEGYSAYSVTLWADYTKNIAAGVTLKENQSGKVWYMSQISPSGAALPGPCTFKSGADFSNLRAYRSASTNMVVYVSVRKEDNHTVRLFVYKSMNFASKF